MRYLILLSLLAAASYAQPADTNYDETKVPRYTLPDPLKLSTGETVKDTRAWQAKRRPEILRLFEDQMFGHAPGRPEKMSFELTSIERSALGGKAVRKEVAINTGGKTFHLLMYLPAKAKGPVPVFLGLNFNGNHAVTNEEGVRLAMTWRRDGKSAPTAASQAAASSRAAAASRWPLDLILAKATDWPRSTTATLSRISWRDETWLRPSYFKSARRGGGERLGRDWRLGVGLEPGDGLPETDKSVDAKRVVLMGHSRLGKTALWAGAIDTRYAIVISTIRRGRCGDQPEDLRRDGEESEHQLPALVLRNYKQYSGREDAMPFDSHMLIALIAPRPVYVAMRRKTNGRSGGRISGRGRSESGLRLFARRGLKRQVAGSAPARGDAWGITSGRASMM